MFPSGLGKDPELDRHSKTDYKFFNLIKKFREDFVRLSEIKVFYMIEPIHVDQKHYERLYGPVQEGHYKAIKDSNKIEIKVEIIKGLFFKFKRREANKIIDDEDSFIFDNYYNSGDYQSKSIDLGSPDEFITRIQGVESLCITKLAFTTNLGHKCEIGNDFVAMSNVNPDDSVQPFSGSHNPHNNRLMQRINL